MKAHAQEFSARRDGVVVEELAGELLIYDRRSDVAHCLGEVAAVAWRSCEDGASIEAIAEQILAAGLASSRKDATVLAQAAVAELGEKDLLAVPSFASERVPRRQALRRIAGAGIAAATGPLVLSVAVPNAYAHASQTGVCSQQKIYFSGSKGGKSYYFEIPLTGGGPPNYYVSGCTSITSSSLPQTGLQNADYGVTATDSSVCTDNDLRILVSGSTYYVCSTDSSWTNDVGGSFLACQNTNGAGCMYWGATSVDPPGEGSPPTGFAAVCGEHEEALMFTCGSGPQVCVENTYSCSSDDQCCSSNCKSGKCA